MATVIVNNATMDKTVPIRLLNLLEGFEFSGRYYIVVDKERACIECIELVQNRQSSDRFPLETYVNPVDLSITVG